jgi:proline dehydrogenase
LWKERFAMSTYDLETTAAAALRHISRNEAIKSYVQHTPELHNTLLKAALRFIGGETLPECLRVAQAVQRRGHAVTIDYMGESTRDEEMAQQCTEEFLRVIRAINVYKLNASISLDLSHIGLVIDKTLALSNASLLAQATQEAGIEMMISMEGSERTDDILALHRLLCARYNHVGITLQAYLHRTPADLAALLGLPARIRLVKGAFEEPSTIAQPRGAALDTVYRNCMEKLLSSGRRCSIATHDPSLLDLAHIFIRERRLRADQIEFEMLYGVTPERMEMMRNRGYQTRLYLPYGQEWYLYLCHRLAEHPPGIYQAIADAAGMGK